MNNNQNQNQNTGNNQGGRGNNNPNPQKSNRDPKREYQDKFQKLIENIPTIKEKEAIISVLASINSFKILNTNDTSLTTSQFELAEKILAKKMTEIAIEKNSEELLDYFIEQIELYLPVGNTNPYKNLFEKSRCKIKEAVAKVEETNNLSSAEKPKLKKYGWTY